MDETGFTPPPNPAVTIPTNSEGPSVPEGGVSLQPTLSPSMDVTGDQGGLTESPTAVASTSSVPSPPNDEVRRLLLLLLDRLLNVNQV